MSTITAPDPVPAPEDAPKIRGVETVPPRMLFWQRVAMVAIVTIPLLGLAAAMWWGYGNGVSAVDIGLFLGFYVFTGLGITVGFHRLLTHKSFKAPTWLRVVFAVAGSMAVQGSVIDWVATHRRHHAYSDQVGDPHSPHLEPDEGVVAMLKGMWHAHVGWMFADDATKAETWAPDLLNEPAMVKVSQMFGRLVLATFLLPAILGGLLTMSFTGAVTGFIWGALVRIFVLHHVTWSINSVCHVFGTRPFDSKDEARNNAPMALLGFGEGWHNAHHAFPASARHGLRWWEIDFSWMLIRTLQVLRVVRDVKVPSKAQIQRRVTRVKAES